jgi:hypothetical protein
VVLAGLLGRILFVLKGLCMLSSATTAYLQAGGSGEDERDVWPRGQPESEKSLVRERKLGDLNPGRA